MRSTTCHFDTEPYRRPEQHDRTLTFDTVPATVQSAPPTMTHEDFLTEITGITGKSEL